MSSEDAQSFGLIDSVVKQRPKASDSDDSEGASN